MPIYRLRRITDQQVFEVDAADEKTSLATFSAQLDVVLSFSGSAAPQYMMGLVPKEAHFAKPEDIPVYEAE